MTDHLIDVKGLKCPLPILRAGKALEAVPRGATLEVLATDPGAVTDFEAFCRMAGNELVESAVEGATYRFVMKHVTKSFACQAGVCVRIRGSGGRDGAREEHP